MRCCARSGLKRGWKKRFPFPISTLCLPSITYLTLLFFATKNHVCFLSRVYPEVYAAYNAGEKTVGDAYKLSGLSNPKWEDLLNEKDPKNSPLYRAIPDNMDKDKKYKEVTEYVKNIMKRKN